jgi:SAM-dependent methyltransferase
MICGHARSDALYEGCDRLCGVPGRFRVVRCRTCGLAETVPRLEGAEMERFYPDSYPAYRAPAAPGVSLRARVGARIDAARFSTAVREGAFGSLAAARPGRLLDVGCGRGELAAWFARRGWRAFGVEPGASAAALARDAGIDVHHGTLDDAPWGAGSFDAVTFNHSLEHIPDPAGALRRARALLRPGGMLVVSVPNFGCWQRRWFGGRWFHLDLPRHLQHFDRVSLPAMMRGAGLEVTSVRSTSSMAGIVGSLQYALWGRSVLSDVGFFRLMHVLYPLVALADRVSEGDCLHVTARA